MDRIYFLRHCEELVRQVVKKGRESVHCQAFRQTSIIGSLSKSQLYKQQWRKLTCPTVWVALTTFLTTTLLMTKLCRSVFLFYSRSHSHSHSHSHDSSSTAFHCCPKNTASTCSEAWRLTGGALGVVAATPRQALGSAVPKHLAEQENHGSKPMMCSHSLH